MVVIHNSKAPKYPKGRPLKFHVTRPTAMRIKRTWCANASIRRAFAVLSHPFAGHSHGLRRVIAKEFAVRVRTRVTGRAKALRMRMRMRMHAFARHSHGHNSEALRDFRLRMQCECECSAFAPENRSDLRVSRSNARECCAKAVRIVSANANA